MLEALYAKIIFLVVAFMAVAGMNYAFKWKNDNRAEQIIEKIVKNQTGLDVDLTPFDGSEKLKTFDLDKAIEEATPEQVVPEQVIPEAKK